MPMQDGDVAGLFPRMEGSRRGFMMTTLATGFTLAVTPAKATITTDSDGLTAGEVKIKVADGEMPAYRAQPAKGGPFPVIIVIEEIFGVHEHIQDMCRRFAKKGYLAIAPELYARLGDIVHMTDVHEIVKLVDKAPDIQSFHDIDATVDWAGKNGGDTKRLGVTGWCRGGRMTWMYAAYKPELKAAVAWYGPLHNKATDEMPNSPLSLAVMIKTPVLGLYAGKDKGIPQKDIDEMKEQLAKLHNKSEFVVYPDAEHGFNADYRPSYNAEAAADAWAKCLAWFAAHGVV